MTTDRPPQQSPSRDADKYIIRFPAGMRDRLAAAAKANSRTMNAEIVARLSATLANGSTGTLSDEQMEELRRKLDDIERKLNDKRKANP